MGQTRSYRETLQRNNWAQASNLRWSTIQSFGEAKGIKEQPARKEESQGSMEPEEGKFWKEWSTRSTAIKMSSKIRTKLLWLWWLVSKDGPLNKLCLFVILPLWIWHGSVSSLWPITNGGSHDAWLSRPDHKKPYSFPLVLQECSLLEHSRLERQLRAAVLGAQVTLWPCVGTPVISPS